MVLQSQSSSFYNDCSRYLVQLFVIVRLDYEALCVLGVVLVEINLRFGSLHYLFFKLLQVKLLGCTN